MGYINPLLKLLTFPGMPALQKEDRERFTKVMLELRSPADKEAERARKRRMGFVAAYWRADSTFARHLTHALIGAKP